MVETTRNHHSQYLSFASRGSKLGQGGPKANSEHLQNKCIHQVWSELSNYFLRRMPGWTHAGMSSRLRQWGQKWSETMEIRTDLWTDLGGGDKKNFWIFINCINKLTSDMWKAIILTLTNDDTVPTYRWFIGKLQYLPTQLWWRYRSLPIKQWYCTGITKPDGLQTWGPFY